MHKNRQFDCESCQIKLLDAHIALRDWFNWLVQFFPDVHIAWSFRGEKEQNEAFFAGKSNLAWPLSLHNFSQNGQACAKALDLFQIDAQGKAVFDKLFYEKIFAKTETAKFPIDWGGKFRSLGDYDHFQLREKKDAI